MIENILRSHRVLICVGSGGVGKTTTSAGLGVLAARLGLKVLVMTIDPSKRLREALGLTSDSQQDILVPGQNFKGELHAAILNVEAIFTDFIVSSTAHPEMAERLLKNRLYQQLSTTLSGSQEFTSLLQLSKMVSEQKYDLVILDTPPAKHAVDFLEAPAKINALFQESIVRWFMNESDNVGVVRKLISRGTQTVLKALEMITGSVFMAELNDFFLSVKAVQHKIAERTQKVQEILGAPSTGFLLVTGLDIAKIKEAEYLHDYLRERQYRLVATIVNRAFPLWFVEESASDGETPMVAGLHSLWRQYHAERKNTFKAFADKWSAQLPIVQIPELNQDVYGIDGLGVVANEVDKAFQRSHFS